MEGYLKKWVNIISGWKPRYFILHDGVLTYCETKGGPTKGSIYLKIATITSNESDPLRITINSGSGEINIRAETLQEKENWLNALKNEQEAALREDEDNKYPEKEIKEYEGRLSVETKGLLKESSLDRLKEQLAQLWVKQAEFSEVLSLMQPKLDKTPGTQNLVEKLETLAHEIKVPKSHIL
jgi:PH domain.